MEKISRMACVKRACRNDEGLNLTSSCLKSAFGTGTHMPAYYIGEHKISNVALFDDYLAKVVPMVERFGGRYLTKAGSHEILEGDWRPNRVVIIEFPDIASIKNWYRAPEYQPLIALRRSAATDVMIMLEGL
jgi:uncharacterized protein (DUF1330 family)